MGKHNAEPAPPTRRRVVVAGGAAVVLVAGGFGVSKAVSFMGAEGGGCKTPASVRVVTTPEMYNTVVAAADAVENEGAACASYDVQAKGSGEAAKAITSNTSVPDVWIPDSTIWADNINAKLGAGWITPGETIATSPVVVAVPQSLRSDARLQKPQSWASILQSEYPLSMVDPNVSSASLTSFVAANQSVSGPNQQKNKQELLRSYLRLSRSLSTEDTLQTKSSAGKDIARLFPTSEQQMAAYNHEHPQGQLSPLVPTEGAAELTYTWTTPVRGTPAPQGALDALHEQLVSAQGKKALTAAGFRVPGAQLPAGTGLPAGVKIAKRASAAESQSAQRAWENLSKDARMLVVLDVSGSMLTDISPGQSRVEMLVKMCTQALDVLPPTTAIGGWAFSTDLDGKGKDYKELVPSIESIDDTPQGRAHKAALTKALGTGPDLAKRNGDTGLYDTVAAAYQRISESYDARYVNSVVVMTDGANDDPNGGLNLQQVLSKLRGQYDPKKPVKIITIGIGDKTDPQALKDIATSTGGLSYITNTPDQITSVFVDAFLRRE
ncbi:substrate-binding domain-containing protein [Luteipulveratus sp. YIM 133132]|uniref:Substrate-binding domain-containing protein n=1 Tax=Luteipulveratus flavus TaxID=3031728 RepID=A0ABT6C4Y3_9MICO|nr:MULTISPECIES: VWA domain-containing protein [unclassified Luteipulveratus]MDE9364233.1 substrate-binding domain-containing protein [Luteipulveratus sp. YIM 133132]MDF8263608.1 substrate-binding domain-containing protein [Luteipulveratus sp. YIM 133296]